MAVVDPKDSVFANAADAVSAFETIFDDEDSIIEMVEGFGENGESLIGRDPEEEFTTDNDDGKVDMEDSSPKTAFNLEPDSETGKGVKESTDLDDLLLDESEEQTDKTNKSDIIEEPVETDEKEFHNEGCDDSGSGSGCKDCSGSGSGCEDKKEEAKTEAVEAEQEDAETGKKMTPKADPNDKEVKEAVDLDELFGVFESDEQTDETKKSDVLEEPVETDKKDFHDGDVRVDNVKESNEEQTDKTNKSDILEEPVETDEKEFHNEGADLDDLFLDEGDLGVQDDLGIQKDLGTQEKDAKCDEISHGSLCPVCGCEPCKCAGKNAEAAKENTDKSGKDALGEIDDKDEKEFHNEGAELDALFEELDLEGEKDHDEFDDSVEGAKDSKKLNEADDIDYAEDELIKAAETEKGGENIKLDYQPGEDDAIIDNVISGKE